jgi:hypothetical protein
MKLHKTEGLKISAARQRLKLHVAISISGKASYSKNLKYKGKIKEGILGKIANIFIFYLIV